MLARDPEEIRRVIADAEAVARGDIPAGPENPSQPSAGSEEAASADAGAASSPTFDPNALGTLAVILTDLLFVRLFGPSAAMPEPLRGETVKAWQAVIVQYAPLIQAAGPLGALIACYGVHLTMCLWQKETLLAQLGEAEAARPPFSGG